MGAEESKIAALRDAGHDEAADLLADLAWHERRAATEEAAKEPPVEAGHQGIPLMPGFGFDPQGEVDGRAVLDARKRFSGDRTLRGSMPPFGGFQAGGR